jgi:hypothetical protein
MSELENTRGRVERCLCVFAIKQTPGEPTVHDSRCDPTKLCDKCGRYRPCKHDEGWSDVRFVRSGDNA